MAKVKNQDIPVRKFAYTDNDGVHHYFGEFYRDVLGEGYLFHRDETQDVVGRTRRGERATEKGLSTPAQHPYRQAFHDCTRLWNSLPDECPDGQTTPPTTAKESVWDAKIEHGVMCSYYDLWMRCCIRFAMSHDGAMPQGDCFPCPPKCSCDDIYLECESDMMFVNEHQVINITSPVEDCVYDFVIISGGGSLSGVAGFARIYNSGCPDPSGVETLVWDAEGSCSEVDAGSSCAVKVNGGMGPYHWWVSGTGFSLGSEETATGENILYASEGCDGTAQIQVKSSCIKNTVIGVKYDGETCDTITIEVRDEDFETVWGAVECVPGCIEDPNMAWYYILNPETISRGGSEGVTITGLNAPFSWSVAGTGFSLASAETEGCNNTLFADETACGSATITVVGCDGQSATGFVRCTVGQWVLKYYGFGLCGAGEVILYSSTFKVIKTEGNKRQTVYHSVGLSGGGSGHDSDLGAAQQKAFSDMVSKCYTSATCLSYSVNCADISIYPNCYKCSSGNLICYGDYDCYYEPPPYDIWHCTLPASWYYTTRRERYHCYYEWEC